MSDSIVDLVWRACNFQAQSIAMQRDEILHAFIAKHGVGPEEVVQVEQRMPDGSAYWFVRPRFVRPMSKSAPDDVRLMAAAEPDYRPEPADNEPRLTMRSRFELRPEWIDDSSLEEMVAEASKPDDERLPIRGETWIHRETGAEYGIIQITNRKAEPQRRCRRKDQSDQGASNAQGQE